MTSQDSGKRTTSNRAWPRWLGGIALMAALGACGNAAQKAVAQEPADDTACTLDGMMLKDFAGPKAQIHYAEGKPEFFCDLAELFGMVLVPESKRAVAGIFVQDMGKTDWDHPQANWIDAKGAVYVVGSRKRGSMGPAFAAFSAMQDAEAFAHKEGGKVVRFNEVTIDMINTAGSVKHDDRMQ
jgi:copper chaperone NosL